MSDKDTPMLCDFGLAAIVDSAESLEPERHSLSSTMKRAGSRRYMAIELLKSDYPGTLVTRETDMWAFGMVVVEVWQYRNNVHHDPRNSARPSAFDRIETVPQIERFKNNNGGEWRGTSRKAEVRRVHE